MEIVGAIASMGQCICGLCCSKESISEQCSYLRRPQTVVEALEDKLKLITARGDDVRTKLQTEEIRRGLCPTAEVTLWLANVQKIKAELDSLKVKIQEHNRPLCGCFPNYYYRLKLGNNISKKICEADKLLDRSNFPESSLVNMLPRKGKILPTTMLVGETAKSILQETLGYLAKRTIVEEINYKLLRENIHFDAVIWVEASKKSNLQQLQKDTAKAMGLCFNENEDSELTRATALHEALLRKGQFLLVIDDLWEAFSLKSIGIPSPTNLNGCKLLITTRLLHVCRSMEADVEIEVRVLSKEDAWDLFKQKVGEELASTSPGIQDVAKKVADECGENNITRWETALSELRDSTASIEGLENQVFARLRFSNDRLKDDRTRSCFLYCALYPEDHHIETEELIMDWIWEGLLGTEGNLVSKMQRGHMILNELKDACMLKSVCQDGRMDEYVNMHDLIRDMVIAFTTENSSFMVKSGRRLKSQPIENEWSPNLERVSLMQNDLSRLTIQPRCPNLCTLLLQYNSLEKGIQPRFFDHMRNLKLPDSLSNLENLHVLLLCSCWNLRHVPTLSELKELRVLDLCHTKIEYMPEGMDMLLNLQHLNLSHTSVSEIPIHVLTTYMFLESLFLIGPWQFTLGQIFTDALSECTGLAVLEVHFSCVEDFCKYLCSHHWNSLKNFKFFIGNLPSSTHTGKNSIAFFGVSSNAGLDDLSMDRILELEFHGCPNMVRLPRLHPQAVYLLQLCKIRHCDRMEFIFVDLGSTYPNLERLEIEGLSKLRGICQGIVPEGTFQSLQVLHVSGCNDLTTLLPPELAKNLINLVEMSIENCEKIAEVIEGVEGDGVTQVKFTDMVLPMLQKMKLSGLPQLKHLYNGLMICDSLSSVEVYECPELKTLPFLVELRKQMLCSLKQIKGSKSWWGELRRNH
ncbi:Apoptotic ATPase [Handroanthus impetiginosus]|uniref:Apoptotic ATPase n=1 Tax=Handroanthus impetiginosus TaxID=429701 RepID=A0A2G9H0N8_9LAMI|nr:Apoptotic ATPase [Handroanthus impetiginosus]